MDIKRNASKLSATGSPDYFTGAVHIQFPFSTSRVGGGIVTFEAGARTAWHSHPLGQTLIVTAGLGRVQVFGEPVQEVRPGDIVNIAPGEKHWHGAAPHSVLTHIDIAEAADGKVVDWMEHVTDEEYSR